MKAVVWTNINCPFSQAVIELLLANGIEVEEKMLWYNCKPKDLDKIRPGLETVPQVFINGQYLGDLEQVKKFVAWRQTQLNQPIIMPANN